MSKYKCGGLYNRGKCTLTLKEMLKYEFRPQLATKEICQYYDKKKKCCNEKLVLKIKRSEK